MSEARQFLLVVTLRKTSKLDLYIFGGDGEVSDLRAWMRFVVDSDDSVGTRSHVGKVGERRVHVERCTRVDDEPKFVASGMAGIGQWRLASE